MNDQQNRPSSMPVPALAILLAAVGVFVFSSTPFKVDLQQTEQPRQESVIRARLWQDPFEAVETFMRRKAGSGAPSSDVPTPHFCRADEPCPLPNAVDCLKSAIALYRRDGNVIVLGVMMPTAPYFEDKELRRRYRYATLSGLRRLGFTPDDPGHIGWAKHPRNANVPYEWLSQKHPERDHVLLVWVDEEFLGQHPLENIRTFVSGFDVPGPNTVSYKFLGPNSSEVLRKMQAEASRFRNISAASHAATGEAGAPIAIYGCLTRKNDDLEIADAHDPKATAGGFRYRNCSFIPVTCSDTDLAGTIVEELKLRGISFAEGSRDMIAIVGEWDTSYGRGLKAVYRRVLHASTMNPDRNLITFGYMRGLDGIVPKEKRGETTGMGADTQQSQQAQESTSGTNLVPRRYLERPDGNSQYDYIRRLAEEMWDMNRHLLHDDGRSIKAIGILGSNPHDKYLMLQALRPRFPQAVFFTTDLDADMLSADKSEVMRNLIIASDFHLSLRNDDQILLQDDVPPFRDSRQTSIFYGVLTAFENDYLPENIRRALHQKGPPRILEVGKTRLVDLSPEAATIHPVQWTREAGRNHFAIGMRLLLIVALLLLFSSGWIRENVRRRRFGASRDGAGKTEGAVTYSYTASGGIWGEGHRVFLVSALAVGVSALVFRMLILNNPNEEPFSLFEGISVWPTEMIRGTGILLSLWFLLKAATTLSDNSNYINARFFADAKEGGTANEEGRYDRRSASVGSGCGGPIHTLRQFVKDIMNYADYNWSLPAPAGRKGPPDCRPEGGFYGDTLTARGLGELLAPVAAQQRAEEPPRDSIEGIWQEYLRRCEAKYVIPRLVILIGLFLWLSCTLVTLEPPVPPLRGRLTALIDMVTLGCCVILYSILTFYAFDQSSMCYRFIKLGMDGKWDDDLVHRFCQKYHKECDLLRKGTQEPDYVLRDWMFIELVAQRTETVGRLIHYPAVIWILMLVSQAYFFDNWQLPRGLATVMTVGLVYTWIGAFLLRKAAEAARDNKLERLTAWLAGWSMRCEPDQTKVQRTKAALSEIAAIRRGAFAPFTTHPLFRVLLTFGGGGAVYAIEFFRGFNV